MIRNLTVIAIWISISAMIAAVAVAPRPAPRLHFDTLEIPGAPVPTTDRWWLNPQFMRDC